MKFTCVSVLMCAMLALSACGSGEDAGSAPADETSVIAGAVEDRTGGADAGIETTEPEVMEFVDANGQSHEAEISDAVTKHGYDWDYLGGSGMSLSYEDELCTGRLGVDASVFSGEIDWETLRDEGVEFAFIRIGGRGYGEAGVLYEDDLGLTNIDSAKQAGIEVGVYFFSQAVSVEEALEEADFVIEMLDGRELDMPVVYDPETIDNDTARTDDVTKEQFTANAVAFCGRIREAGYEPAVYCNMLWEAFNLDLAALEEAGTDIWYADYEPEPQTPYYFTWWQFAEDVAVEGAEYGVDLNMQFVGRQKED